MEDIKNINSEELEKVSGGVNPYGWVTVKGLESGYLALRTAPCYDYSNEIRGSESYNGQQLRIDGAFVTGSDGRSYVWVYNPRSGKSGYVNANYVA